MTSAGFNVTSSLTLVGFSSLSGHSSLLFFVFLLLYLFVLSVTLCVYLDLMLRRLQATENLTPPHHLHPDSSTYCTEPVVYGLKLKEVFTHVKRLLSCRRDS
ncbi:Olfactory receptor 10K1 [Dissostichus eleginoides]|uniref:Olfactory receptor 10K1 n=1 Tax=Dissostichus eleginoides TaxID=100907 RepID=A0AAD9B2I9_DISEL|nr:Olfactory receptor 10K1 [Dissostichus eleginoides]